MNVSGQSVLPCVLDPYVSDDTDIYMCPWGLPDNHMASHWRGQGRVCLTHPSEKVIVQMNKKNSDASFEEVLQKKIAFWLNFTRPLFQRILPMMT